MEIQITSVISRIETQHLANKVGDELILLNMETGDYLGLNTVGASIWENLSLPISVSELVGRLAGSFEVDAETCQKETIEYLKKIAALDLIHIDP
jgi:hypothetical protein